MSYTNFSKKQKTNKQGKCHYTSSIPSYPINNLGGDGVSDITITLEIVIITITITYQFSCNDYSYDYQSLKL